MDCSMPGFPVHHQLPELAQTHVHRICDTIQPSYPLLLPSLPAFNLSQQSGSFKISLFFSLGGQSIGVSASASVLPVNIQDWSPSEWTGWISLQSKGLSRVFSNTTVQKLWPWEVVPWPPSRAEFGWPRHWWGSALGLLGGGWVLPAPLLKCNAKGTPCICSVRLVVFLFF